MNVPIFYDYQNVHSSSKQPSQIFTQNNATARFYQRYLLQKAMSVFQWTFPETWKTRRGDDYFLYCLYCFGFVCVVNTDKFGVIPQACTLGGYGVFYEPKYAVVANPLISGIMQPVIGRECEIIKLQRDFGGVLDIVYQYAELMALAATSVSVNLLNSKFAYVFAAQQKAGAESFKKMYSDISSGNPAVFIDKALFKDDGSPAWELFQQNLKQQYIASDILTDMRKIEAEFDTRIGIPNANTDKRERLVTDEVNANNVGTNALAAQWLDELKTCIDRVHDMFGEKVSGLSVDWNYNIRKGLDANEQSSTVNAHDLQS